jgi:hypothetical protein
MDVAAHPCSNPTGASGLPVSVAYTRPTVELMLTSRNGRFEGNINSANTEITGSWIQAGQSTPATLKRADYHAEHIQDAERDYSFNSKDDLQGHWAGSWIVTLAQTKAPIRFALDVAKLPAGSYSAALANIDEFGHDAPMPTPDFHYEAPKLRMQWKWAGGSYEGILQNGKLIGAWFQGGGGFPLVFERTAPE